MSDFDFDEETQSFWSKNLAGIIAFSILVPVMTIIAITVLMPSISKIA